MDLTPLNKRRRLEAQSGLAERLAECQCAACNLPESALKSLRLWADGRRGSAASALPPGQRPQAWRTPKEVARLRFFDTFYVGTRPNRVSANSVEREILACLLWTLRKPDAHELVTFSKTVQNALRPTAELLDHLKNNFECWPSTEDYKIIHSGCKARGIDILVDILPPSAKPGIIDVSLDTFAMWLTKPGDNDKAGYYEQQAWHRKICAVAVSLHLCTELCLDLPGPFANKKEECENDVNTSVFDDLPNEILPYVAPFFDATTSRLFASSSTECKRVVRCTPELEGVWRRNLYFARSATFEGCVNSWDWKVVCAEDCPVGDSLWMPEPCDMTFLSSKATSAPGGFNTCEPVGITAESLIGESKTDWAYQSNRHPFAFFDVDDRSEFGFYGTNPFDPEGQPIAIRGLQREGSTPPVMVFVGHDEEHGCFIGTCGGPQKGLRATGALTLCARYLSYDDSTRIEWSAEELLARLVSEIASGHADASKPWRSHLFSHDYWGEIPPSFRPRSFPAYKLELSLILDLRGRADELLSGAEVFMHDKAHFAGYDFDHHCAHCQRPVEEDSLVSYKNDGIPGLDRTISLLQEAGCKFCDNECFLAFFSSACCSVPIIEHSAIWNEQCISCGILGAKHTFEVTPCFTDKRYKGWVEPVYPMPFLWCCSRDCSRSALKEVVRFCKREWQTCVFTRGVRRVRLELSQYIQKDADAIAYLKSEGLAKSGGESPGEYGYEEDFWFLKDPSDVGLY